MKAAIIVILFASVLVSGARGQTLETGNELLVACGAYERFIQSAKPRVEDINGEGACMGFISALIEYEGTKASRSDDYAACLPADGTVGQAVLVVQKYLATHPEILHLGAWPLSRMAL